MVVEVTPVTNATMIAMMKQIRFLIIVILIPKYSFSIGKVISPTSIRVVVNAERTI